MYQEMLNPIPGDAQPLTGRCGALYKAVLGPIPVSAPYWVVQNPVPEVTQSCTGQCSVPYQCSAVYWDPVLMLSHLLADAQPQTRQYLDFYQAVLDPILMLSPVLGDVCLCTNAQTHIR